MLIALWKLFHSNQGEKRRGGKERRGKKRTEKNEKEVKTGGKERKEMEVIDREEIIAMASSLGC